MVGGRWVHAAWQDEPEYRPDHSGEIRNRDFFGGSLQGVEEKLDYLHSLGVRTLYFCPIFEAAENHRYGTADYRSIDPMLGTEEDFSRLCQKAHRLGMRVMLDGCSTTRICEPLFQRGRLLPGAGGPPEPGTPPYYSWYNFYQWPDQYESWWGIYSLPSMNEHDPAYGNSSSAGRTRWSGGGFGRVRTAGGWTWPTSSPTTSWRGSTPPPGRRNPTR